VKAGTTGKIKMTLEEHSMHLIAGPASARRPLTKMAALFVVGMFVLALTACGDDSGEDEPGATSVPQVTGSVAIDGSSTVFPITEAVAEEFQKVQKNVKVTVGISGTGGGFQKFCNGEIDISEASRPIRPTEIDACKAKSIEFVEIPVAFDALSVVVSTQNNFISCMTTAELKKLWEPAAAGNVTRWNQVRADWPNEPIALYGAGTDSGTFEYFTEAINGTARQSRPDYTPSEDDNVLVQGIAGNRNALGYFGLAYLVENQTRVKAVQVDEGKGRGCVTPSAPTVENGTYTPLSRPLFIYVKKDVAARPDVKAFVDYYLKEGPASLVKEVGYVPFPQKINDLAKARWSSLKVGTAYTGDVAGKTVEQIYTAAQ
jgi:phosphate transport system substrate-binding protein